MYERSILRRYEGGYTLHEIDAHPDGSYYRDPGNHYTAAYPEERYMLMRQGTIVCFMESVGEMSRLFPNLKEINDDEIQERD